MEAGIPQLQVTGIQLCLLFQLHLANSFRNSWGQNSEGVSQVFGLVSVLKKALVLVAYDASHVKQKNPFHSM